MEANTDRINIIDSLFQNLQHRIILKLGDVTLRTVRKDFVVSASEQRDVEVGGGDGNRGDTGVRQRPH